MPDACALLDREVAVLAERLRHWPVSRWGASAAPYATRADAAFALAQRFADLAHAPGALPRVGDHVIADQIAVTGHELAAAGQPAETIATALEELRRARELLGIS